MKIALFPGSFDPFTKGHLDVVERGTELFDKVIIAIGYNTSKQRYFALPTIKEKIESCTKANPKIEVTIFEGLTSEYAKQMGARFLLRGLRNTLDFEYENAIAKANKNLNPELDTVFLLTDPAYSHISSTIVREIHKFNGNVEKFLPYFI